MLDAPNKTNPQPSTKAGQLQNRPEAHRGARNQAGAPRGHGGANLPEDLRQVDPGQTLGRGSGLSSRSGGFFDPVATWVPILELGL